MFPDVWMMVPSSHRDAVSGRAQTPLAREDKPAARGVM